MSHPAIKSWSYSRYALHAMCPLKFKLKHIDRIDEPDSPAMRRGNEIHKGIADYLQDKADGVPAEATQHRIMEKLLLEIKNWPHKQVEQQWGFTHAWAPTGWFAKDTWLRSVLDVNVIYDDMTAEVVDWKSGKRYGSNDDQMELFALSVMCQLKPVTHVTTRLAYLDSGDQEIAEFPATHKTKLMEKWEKKVEPMFNDTLFPPRPNDKCRFCTYSRSNMGKCSFG